MHTATPRGSCPWPRWALLALAVAALAPSAHGAKILGVLPYRGWSHFAAFQPLLVELARRGHDVTVFSPFDPPKDAPKSYKVLPVKYETEMVREGTMDADTIYSASYSFMGIKVIEALSDELCQGGLKDPAVQKLLASKDQYDLVFVEVFHTDCFLPFIEKFKAPVIGLSSCGLMPWAMARMGAPSSLAFVPSIFIGLSDEMSLLERVRNTVEYVWASLYYAWYEWGRQKLVKSAFGPDTPSTFALDGKIDLMLVNSHETVHAARPLPPTIINVAGMHLPKPQPLPEDLRAFIEGAKDGVIYFNMGSLLRGESFPKPKVDALLEAFRQLKQRVIWKWEGVPPKNAPANVKFMAWVRQFDVLQHPNVKLFMSHGGMLGTTEAVHWAKPIIVIPMFGDQPHNAAGLVRRGVARKLPYPDLADADKVLDAVRDVLENPKYAEAVKRNSAAFRDRPLSPLDTAVYWTEFVIRHKGAEHLRPRSAEMPYYQLWLVDVFLVLLSPILLLYWAVSRCCGRGSDRRKSKRD